MSGPFLARLAEERAAPGAAAVLGGVRRAVLAGDAPPGTTVPLDAVAAVFGTSVIPVREALKTLVGEGLITQRPRGGYTVARLTAAELAELYVVRGLLEQGALAIATERATPSDHDRARAAHARLGAAQGDERAYHRESRAFHLALVAPSRMHRLQAMLESAWNITEPYRPMARVPVGERALLHDEHGAMLDAFLRADADDLRARAAQHHEHLRRTIDALFTDGRD